MTYNYGEPVRPQTRTDLVVLCFLLLLLIGLVIYSWAMLQPSQSFVGLL